MTFADEMRIVSRESLDSISAEYEKWAESYWKSEMVPLIRACAEAGERKCRKHFLMLSNASSHKAIALITLARRHGFTVYEEDGHIHLGW